MFWFLGEMCSSCAQLFIGAFKGTCLDNKREKRENDPQQICVDHSSIQAKKDSSYIYCTKKKLLSPLSFPLCCPVGFTENKYFHSLRVLGVFATAVIDFLVFSSGNSCLSSVGECPCTM